MGGNTDLIEEWKDIVLSGRKRDQLQAELGKEYAPQILGAVSYTHLDVYKRQMYNVLQASPMHWAESRTEKQNTYWLPQLQQIGTDTDSKMCIRDRHRLFQL